MNYLPIFKILKARILDETVDFNVEYKTEKATFRYDSGILNKVSMLMACNENANLEDTPRMWAPGREIWVGQTVRGR